MRTRKKSPTNVRSERRPLSRPVVACVTVLLVAAFGVFFGPKFFAAWACRKASRELDLWAIDAAERWLAWSAWVSPGSEQTYLLQAACCRRRGQMDRWKIALQVAKQKGASPKQLERESKLALIQSGEFYAGADRELGLLIDSGAPAQDVGTAFLEGYLACDDSDRAQLLLETWQAEFPDEPHLAYLRGIYWRWLGERDHAQAEFEKVLSEQPRHELSRAALAELLEQQDRLDEALQQYLKWIGAFPGSEQARIGLAGVLRKLNRVEEARSILEPLASRPTPTSRLLTELGRDEMESGNLSQAEQYFQQLNLNDLSEAALLSTVGISLALNDQPLAAEPFFDRAAAADGRLAHRYDLRVKLALNPENAELARQFEALAEPIAPSHPGEAGTTRTERSTSPQAEVETAPLGTAARLYETYCASCHGTVGDGNGRARRHLFPKPRDFRNGKFRLVSTRNGVPTEQDLVVVLRRGMPGTSMRAYDDLSGDDQNLLVQEVLRMFREGLRSKYVDLLKSEGEQIDEKEIAQVVADCSTPNEVVDAVGIEAIDDLSVSRGRELYVSLGCNNCHGDNGVGAWDVWLPDDTGLLARPRDLVHEPFKGGTEPESIYFRVAVGMPGTPHPTSYGITERQRIDLVQYCRSLSRLPKRNLSNFERETFASGNAYLAAFGDSPARTDSL